MAENVPVAVFGRGQVGAAGCRLMFQVPLVVFELRLGLAPVGHVPNDGDDLFDFFPQVDVGRPEQILDVALEASKDVVPPGPDHHVRDRVDQRPEGISF